MDTPVTLKMGDESVRFTPDGQVSIIDAIRALGGDDESEALWESIKSKNPEILEHCEPYSFGEGKTAFVTGTEAWDEFIILLADHLLNRGNT